ncbi:MAG TPA: hypothetical protein VLM38_02465 [Blastocatellia bacterium]|nr:hypothetical protein [Blastocatellia bacterium]
MHIEHSHFSDRRIELPDGFPSFLRRSNNDTPVPSWKQLTRSLDEINPAMIGHVGRIIAGVEDEQAALEVWDGWSGSCRRSVALIIDKICNEGWLDTVGPMEGWPWDGGFFFRPCAAGQKSIEDALDAKTDVDGVYTRCEFRDGLAAYLSRWNHKGWRRGWIENDSPLGSLHVGIFENGSAEVHLDLFNPLYTNGAPRSEVTTLPGIGAYNYKLFRLHRKWEGTNHATLARTSANFYHLMRERVPLCF